MCNHPESWKRQSGRIHGEFGDHLTPAHVPAGAAETDGQTGEKQTCTHRSADLGGLCCLVNKCSQTLLVRAITLSGGSF